MRREQVTPVVELDRRDGNMIAYGHYGRPLLVFPSEQGSVKDYEDRR